MKLATKILIVVLMAIMFTGCNRVDVPAAHKGKVLTTAGYSPDILNPGRHDIGLTGKMIMIQTGTRASVEKVTVLLSDKLTLTADVKFRGRISSDEKILNAVFNDGTPNEQKVITFANVYNVYGKMAIRNKAREIISQYSTEEVHKNYARISKEIANSVTDALQGTPVEVSDMALGDIKYPAVVTNSINEAKQREMEIKKEYAQAKIDLARKANEKILAEADYQIQITKAKAVRDANRIIGEGITPALLDLKRIEAIDKATTNKNTVFLPVESMLSTGAQIRMYGK